MMTDAATAAVTLAGEVQSIVFRSEDTGHSVMRVAVAGNRDPSTVIGVTFAATGEVIEAQGQWITHPKYGRQFQAAGIMVQRPTSRHAILRYLQGGAIPGIGKVLAERIVATFGDRTTDALDAGAEALRSVPGLGEKKAKAICDAWAESRATHELMAQLAGYGITPALAARIARQYGPAAPDIVKRTPYRLATEVRGVGFATADAIAKANGIAPDAPDRIEAGLLHLIGTVGAAGHTGVPQAAFLERASTELLHLPEHVIRPVFDDLIEEGKRIVWVNTPAGDGEHISAVFDGRLFRAEKRIAQAMSALRVGRPTWSEVLDAKGVAAVVAEAEKAAGVPLSDEQRRGVEMAVSGKVGVLTGGPGTGKTSTLRVILEAMRVVGAKVALAAPTGKAAKRMRETTGHAAATLARLTGMGVAESDDELPQIEADILIVDEASMVDVPLFDRTLKCLSSVASLLLVGDVDQLPSVGPGRVLADILDSQALPVTRLTQVFRQAAASRIIRNAHRINTGLPLESEAEAPPESLADMHFLSESDPEAIADRIVALVSKHIPERIGIEPEAIQVLSPMRKTPTGADALNRRLQAALNPNPGRFVERGGRRFGVGDRVLQTVNNYDLGVMNGESGIVTDVDHEAKEMMVNVDGMTVAYPFNELDQLDLSYAMSIHKSQGSQFDAVIIPVTTQHYMMLQRSILYTGLTRASRFCVLIGQPKALNMAIQNVKPNQRMTLLCHRLMGKVRA